MPRPGTKDKKLYFLITGEELAELQSQSWKMMVSQTNMGVFD
jgi:hypothetical protein